MYASLKKNGINVDIRGFKKKQVTCNQKNCVSATKPFDIQM